MGIYTTITIVCDNGYEDFYVKKASELVKDINKNDLPIVYKDGNGKITINQNR